MIQYNNIPLTAEERHAFTEIVSKGEYVRIRDREYLMVEISPMVRDFLNASRMKLVARGEETGPARATTPDDPELTLDQAIGLFVEDRKAGWGESSHQAYERVFKILRECLGREKIIRDVAPRHLAGVKELILGLPRNYGVLFPGLPLWTAVERGADLPKRSTTTANNELKYVATFFEWAHAKWIIDRHPARQFMLPAQDPPPGSALVPPSDRTIVGKWIWGTSFSAGHRPVEPARGEGVIKLAIGVRGPFLPPGIICRDTFLRSLRRSVQMKSSMWTKTAVSGLASAFCRPVKFAGTLSSGHFECLRK